MYIRVYDVRMRVYLCVCMRIEAAFRIFGSCVYQVFAGSVDDPPNASWMGRMEGVLRSAVLR